MIKKSPPNKKMEKEKNRILDVISKYLYSTSTDEEKEVLF